jgi:3',5'-cyclic AMP phosphodiesterase CpdA
MFTLAHLSDPHIPPLPVPRFSELLSKRLFGFINWQKKSSDIHRYETLESLVADIKKQSPDHFAITGDLVNLSLPDEFPQARLWLNRLGPAADVTLIAGNHDAYVRKMEGEPKRAWGEYMRGDGETQTSFPFVRKRGPIAIVGLSTSVASGWSKATGKLGKVQLAALPAILKRLGEEGLFRIVSLHHPPQSEPKRKSQRLLDGQDFLATIAQAGADLIIHGHDHIHQVSWVDGAGRRVPVVGVPSASAAPRGHWQPAGFNLYRIDGTAGAWRCEMASWSMTKTGETVETGRRMLTRAQG